MKYKCKAGKKPPKGKVGNPANRIHGKSGGKGPKKLTGRMNKKGY